MQITEKLANMLRGGSHWQAFEATGFLKSLLLSSACWKTGTDQTQMQPEPFTFFSPLSSPDSILDALSVGWSGSVWHLDDEKTSFSFGWSRCGKKLLEAFKTKQNPNKNPKSGEKETISLLTLENPVKTCSDFAILFKILFLPSVDRFWLFILPLLSLYFWQVSYPWVHDLSCWCLVGVHVSYFFVGEKQEVLWGSLN